MHPAIYLITILLPFTTAIIIFSMKYASSYSAARAKLADQADFRKLAEANAASLAQITASLKLIEADIARQGTSLSSVETILKQVG